MLDHYLCFRYFCIYGTIPFLQKYRVQYRKCKRLCNVNSLIWNLKTSGFFSLSKYTLQGSLGPFTECSILKEYHRFSGNLGSIKLGETDGNKSKLDTRVQFSNNEINVQRHGNLVQLLLTPSTTTKMRNGITLQVTGRLLL